MYTHIYISRPIRPSECLHTKIHVSADQYNTSVQKTGSPAYKQQKCPSYIRGPLSHPYLLLPQEEVVAYPHLPQAVAEDHPQDPPALAVGVHSSSQPALLLTALWPAMVVAPPQTALGSSHPGSMSTCPQARPATPSPDDGVYHQSPLQLYIGLFPNFHSPFREPKVSIFQTVFSHGINIPSPTSQLSLGHFSS
jgi:hypothetical protein